MKDLLSTEALRLLRRLTGDEDSVFRDDQLDVISALVGDRRRMLLVQRTGWGKSAVYFIATRMLRDRGAGVTLLVSPLLALMRNQMEAAERMGVRAATINSANPDEWGLIESQLDSDDIDLLLISPERLANPEFRANILAKICRRSGLLVVDEAHCISDWGHDFRPDYRRLVRLLDLLPAGVPVLCCTATANDRVVDDVVAQLGPDLELVRGQLAREGLRLAVLDMPQQAQRLAWLAETVPRLPGTGIVYCLTIADTERVAGWLQANGVSAIAYSGNTDSEKRESIEQALLSNEFKVVVSTSALGMGFDKPDLAFVIHYQSPGSPIAYYQQVGRAGRGLSESWGILLRGTEDADVQNHFISTAFPARETATHILNLLSRVGPVSRNDLLADINVRPKQLDHCLKVLEVEGAVEREGGRWQRTLNRWTFDRERVSRVTALRQAEQRQMDQYIAASDCRMRLLRGFLDDPAGEECGICDNCNESGIALSVPPPEKLVAQASHFLQTSDQRIQPRKQLPDRVSIPKEQRLEVGRALAVWGDGGWGSLVRSGKQEDGRFDDQLVEVSAALIKTRWHPDPPPVWVTYVPSLCNTRLMPDFAERLAAALGLPCERAVEKVRNTEPQKTMQSSQRQYANVKGVFRVRVPVLDGPVLLVDDIVDSRWTMTVVGWKLREAGVSHVYPFALADAAGRSQT